MNQEYPKAVEYPKAEVSKRITAGLIDAGVFIVLYLIIRFWIFLPDYWAFLIASVYILLRDALFQGQSIGKRIIRLKVVNRETQKVATYRDSIKRNVIFFIPNLLRFIPALGGLLGLAVLILEGYFISSDEKGFRWGDNFAKTQVVEESVAV